MPNNIKKAAENESDTAGQFATPQLGQYSNILYQKGSHQWKNPVKVGIVPTRGGSQKTGSSLGREGGG